MNALAYILGYTDGHLEPQPLTGEHWQADKQAQATYAETGALRITNPCTGNQAERKRYEREVEALVQRGLVFEHGRAIGLTVEGDAEARRMAGLPTLDRALDLLAALASSPDRWSEGWISESSLCGMEPLPRGRIGKQRTPEKKVAAYMPYMASLLAARLVTWRDVDGLDGVLLYRPSATGHERANEGAASKWWKLIRRPSAYTPPPDYVDGWRAAYTAREHAKPAKPNLIHHADPVDAPRPRRR